MILATTKSRNPRILSLRALDPAPRPGVDYARPGWLIATGVFLGCACTAHRKIRGAIGVATWILRAIGHTMTVTAGKLRHLLNGCVIAVCAVAVTSARGDLSLEILGDPIPGGSWFQDFRLAAPYQFKGLGIVLTLPDSTGGLAEILYDGFEDIGPPAIDFSIPGGTAGWAQDLFVEGPDFGHTVQALGIFSNEVIWRSHFRDLPESQAFTMNLFAYDNPEDALPFGEAAATWTGDQWIFDVARSVTWEEYQEITHTPTPSACFLGAMGLTLVGLIRKRSA